MKNCYGEIWEEIGDGREWSIPFFFFFGFGSSIIGYKKLNGGRNEIFERYL